MARPTGRLSTSDAWPAQRVLAAVLLAIAALALLTSVTPSRRPEAILDLRGPWHAEVLDPPLGATTLHLPGLFAAQGLPPDALVALRRTVTLPEGGRPYDLFVERAQYAAIARWDGVEFARLGDPDGDARAFRPLQAAIPDTSPGAHELELVVRGDWGKGGLVGSALVGPDALVDRLAARREGRWLAFASAALLIALLHLGLASRRAPRAIHLLFGTFALASAMYAIAFTAHAADLVPDGLTRLRTVRVAEGLAAPVAVGFLAWFGHARLRRAEQALLGFGAVSALLSVLLPSGWLYHLEVVQDLTSLSAGAWSVGLLATAIRRNVEGAPVLIGGVACLLLGVTTEIAVTHGTTTMPSWLLPTMVLFLGAASMAVMVREAADGERHRRLVRDSGDALVIVDGRGGVVVDANPAALRLLGPHVVGRPLAERVHPDDRAVARAHVHRSGLGAHRAELRLADDDGDEVVVESMGTPIDHRMRLLVLRDVTRRREIDASLLHAARVETVGTLVGGLAHDFNNMLAALLANVGLLKLSADGGDERAERLERMENAIERASLLTRRLLTLGGQTSTPLGPTDLGRVLRDACDLAEPTLPQSVALERDWPADLPPVHGVASDLEHVVVNLVVNARDAMKKRGTIRVRARAFDLPDAGPGVVIAVEDDGPGVPPDIRDQIWRPFFSTKGSLRGTGLGLAVADQVARTHFGRLWYEDLPGGGARFLVALRLGEQVEALPGPMPGGRVLVVEDEPAVLQAYVTALRDAGYQVVACSDGMEARQELHEAPPDVLVTDIVLPGLSGLQLAELCHELYPRVPILLVSGYLPEDALPPLPDAVWTRLDKPVRPPHLLAAIGNLRRRAEHPDEDEGDEHSGLPTFEGLTGAMIGLNGAQRGGRIGA